jgi:hypothetical protein
LSQFRLVVSYNNPRCTETFTVHAESLSEASAICERMISDQADKVERLASKNIFLSKRACGCEVDQNAASSSLITTVT